MNFNEINSNLHDLSNIFCTNIIDNYFTKSEALPLIRTIKKLINSEKTDNPKIYLNYIDAINSGIITAFNTYNMSACNALFMIASYEDDYKNSIQTYDNLYSKFDKKHDPYITEFHIERKENSFDSLGLLLDPFRHFLTSNIDLYRKNSSCFDLSSQDCVTSDEGISELYKINKELLLKTEYLYIQKQLERQIYNFKHEPADLYNQRFNSITENNLKEITKSLKGRDIYSLNDENKLQKISSLKALQELLYHSHIKELNSIVILKDKRDSREPSVMIDDEVRFKMLHLIKPFEQKIKNVVSLNNQSCHK